MPLRCAYTFAVLSMLVACGDKDVGADSAQPEPVSGLGTCEYRNAFTSAPECKDYTGDAWTLESAAQDCETGIVGGAGTFTEDGICDLNPILGVCTTSSDEGLEYSYQLGGDDASGCSGAELACTTFAGGVFEEAGVCMSGEAEDGHTVFIWPYETCEQPLEDEPEGEGPDGDVCTWNLISGCTEEGRDFRDYGSCDVVFTNRPYYSVDPYGNAADDDPRLSDDAYLEELSWVTEQVKSCACVCCHSSAAADGPAIWGVEDEVLWPEQMSDTAVGMFAGYIDSSALGAFPPEENNGFDREQTAMPSTDPERMVAFWLDEMDRRGLSPDDLADEPPVGQDILEQVYYDLPDCGSGEGVDAEGIIRWTDDFDARYAYILEEGSDNPGIPPNFDMPEGVIWRVDVPHDGQPFSSGITYGKLPETSFQVFPDDGSAPPELVPGKRYHLYVLYDLVLPIGRCVFEMPEAESNDGCSTAGSPVDSVWLLLAGGLLMRRRRERAAPEAP